MNFPTWSRLLILQLNKLSLQKTWIEWFIKINLKPSRSRLLSLASINPSLCLYNSQHLLLLIAFIVQVRIPHLIFLSSPLKTVSQKRYDWLDFKKSHKWKLEECHPLFQSQTFLCSDLLRLSWFYWNSH